MSIYPLMGFRGLLAHSPLLTTVRHKARINIQKPKLPHWQKALFQRLTERQLPVVADALSEHHGCFHAVEMQPERETNPLEVVIGTQIREACENSELIVFLHRNSVSMTDIHKAWQLLKRAGFTYHKLFNNAAARHAFSGTRLEPVLQLCRSHTSLITCPEPRVAKLLKLQKKMPQLIVLGGVVQERFMSVADLEAYARLPPLAALHTQLCHLLAGPAAGFSASLNHHQTALVRSLAEHSAGAETPPTAGPSDGGAAS